MKTNIKLDEWDVLVKFLPVGWESKAQELGALTRKRKFKDPETLLRVLLIHLADGKSLRTTSAYAKEAKLCDVNDVALLHRLKASEDWFCWIANELFASLRGRKIDSRLFKNYRVRLVDGTSVSEQGSTGSDWRIHYSFQLNTFRCDEFKVTSIKTVESFGQYTVRPEDLIIGDRGYCKRKGIVHVLNSGAQVMVRFHSSNLPLFSRLGKVWNPLAKLKTLKKDEVGDWDVWFKNPENDELIKGRLCAVRKSKNAIEMAHKKLRRMSSKKGKKLRPETLEYAEYIILFTTVNRRSLKGVDLLLLYRSRWQIELVFKRLKSILGVGHLPKYNPESCKAWLYGKMIVALLAEKLQHEAEFFSPWGYPIQ